MSGFERVLLEESFVLDVVARPGRVEVTLEVVLLEGHDAYRAPRPDEQFCYSQAMLAFVGVTQLSWNDQGRLPAVDASGAVDYGSVDLFERLEGSWRFVGDWGELVVSASAIEFALREGRW
ncbi:MAG TPA: hypothetical protein VNQ73_00660 [Ilumatobacter sp.]|nr:hypothetical protein [Ilumatobacter sp.]